MAVHAGDVDVVSSQLVRAGQWEISHPQQLANLADASLPTSDAAADADRPVLLDIGSNVGYYSLLFAHFGWRVVAVEPMLHNRLAIESSLCRLGGAIRRRVTVLAAAVGTAAEAALDGSRGNRCVARAPRWGWANGVLSCGRWAAATLPSGSCGTESTLFDRMAKRQAPCQFVNMTTIDTIVSRVLPELGIGRVDVVKFDIESHECAALSAGHSLFTRHRPRFIQWEGSGKGADACFRDAAATYGYRVGQRFGHDRNTVMTTAPARTAAPRK